MQLRMLKVLALERYAPRISAEGVAPLRLRVWPHEIDVNRHLNNARYFAVADVGRLAFWLRAGWWPTLRARGWNPVAGDASARFSRSLQPFEAYTLETRMLGWDEKWFFAEHRFIAGGRVCAVVLVRYLLFTCRGPRPRPADLFEALGQPAVSPPLPEWVQGWSSAQDLLSAQLKQEAAGLGAA